MEELKKVIDLPAISDAEISKKGISLGSLWMVKDKDDKVYGPYDTEILKVYIARYEYLFNQTKIYNLETEKWNDTFEINFFQRRQRVSQNTNPELATNDFYIHLNNQQSGPYTKDEIQNFLNNGQIKSSSDLSIDKGESWIKVFEHHAFDRRGQKTNQELPYRPAQEVLEHMALTKEEILKAKEADEAIVELAFLGHQKSTSLATKNSPFDQDENASKKEDRKFKKSTKILFTASACAALTLAFIFSYLSDFGKSDDKFQEITNSMQVEKNILPNNIVTKRNVPTTQPREVLKKITPKPVAVQARRYPTRAKKRVVVRDPKPKPERVNPIDDIREEIDVNDPEIQEEITRALAGEEAIEEDQPYLNEEPIEEDLPENGYEGMEDPVSHSEEDY